MAQNVTVQYFSGVTNPVVNPLGYSVRKLGIFTGGHFSTINSTTVSVSPLTCEIIDSGNTTAEQVYITVNSATSVTVSNSVPTMVILQWTYTASSSASLQFIPITPSALSSYTNALVVGVVNANGSFDYTLRSNPNVMDLFLKVEPPETADSAPLSVRVRGGQINYGDRTLQVVDQLVPLNISGYIPGSGSRIVAIQVQEQYISGNYVAVIVPSLGAISGGTPVPPLYNGLVTLAEVLLVSGMGSFTPTYNPVTNTYTSSNIKDVRGWVSVATPPNVYVDLVSNQSIAGIKTFTGGLVIPAVTSDPVSTVNGQIWLRTDF